MSGTYPGYHRLSQKPLLGYGLDRGHPFARGLGVACLLNEAGGFLVGNCAGQPQGVVGSPYSWAAGNTGPALRLASSLSDAGQVVFSGAVPSGMTSYTWAIRVRPDSSAGGSAATKGPVIGSDCGGLSWDNAGSSFRAAAYQQNASGSYFSVTAASTVTGGSWWHLAGVWDGANLKYYVNGTLIGSAAVSSLATTNGTLTLGQSVHNLTGLYEYLYWWPNRALSAAEIAAFPVHPYGLAPVPPPRRAFAAPAGGGGSVTGAGAATLRRVTSAGTGTVTDTGAGSAALRRVTAAGSGSVTDTGSGSPSLARVRAAGSGSVTDAGTGTATLRRVTASGTGSVTDAGTGSVTLRRVTASGTGAVTTPPASAPMTPRVFSGTLFSSPGGLYAPPGSGGGTDTGAGAATLRRMTAAGSGSVADPGSGSPSLARVRAAGSGAVTDTGAGAATLRRMTAAGSGAVNDPGTDVAAGSPRLRRLASAGSGAVTDAGTGSATLRRLASAGAGSVTDPGSGSPRLRRLAASGTGSVADTGPDVGTGTPSLRRLAAAGTGAVTGTAAAVPPPVSPLRDRPILALVRDAIKATGEFDDVTTSGLPETAGRSAGLEKLAGLELAGWKEAVISNDPAAVQIERTVHFVLTIHVRDDDPDARDDELDRLFSVAANAVNGNSFGGVTYTDWTYLSGGVYQPEQGGERRLRCTGQFVYDISSWNTRNTTVFYT